MRAARAVVCAGLGCSALLACLRTTPPPPPPELEEEPEPASSPVPAELDDPGSCLDAPSAELEARQAANDAEEQALETEVRRRIAEQWPRLSSCPGVSGSTAAVLLHIDVGMDGTTNARVVATELADCEGITCIRDGLSGLQIASPRADRAFTFGEKLELDPVASPRSHAEPVKARLGKREQPTVACLDEPNPLAARLPPKLIRDIVRSHYGTIRTCYDEGLRRNPDLIGKVMVRFAIGRDGMVMHAAVRENELPDCAVARCIRDVFAAFTFPPPERGIVTVSYPIMFEPPGTLPAAPSAKAP